MQRSIAVERWYSQQPGSAAGAVASCQLPKSGIVHWVCVCYAFSVPVNAGFTLLRTHRLQQVQQCGLQLDPSRSTPAIQRRAP